MSQTCTALGLVIFLKRTRKGK